MEGGGGAESVSQLSDSIVGVREVFRVSIRLPMHIDFLQQLPDAHIVRGCDHLLLSKAPCISRCFPQLFLRAKLITLFLIPECAQPAFRLNREESHVSIHLPMHIEGTQQPECG